jgi:hypothetical protein
MEEALLTGAATIAFCYTRSGICRHTRPFTFLLKSLVLCLGGFIYFVLSAKRMRKGYKASTSIISPDGG